MFLCKVYDVHIFVLSSFYQTSMYLNLQKGYWNLHKSKIKCTNCLRTKIFLFVDI